MKILTRQGEYEVVDKIDDYEWVHIYSQDEAMKRGMDYSSEDNMKTMPCTKYFGTIK